MSQTSQTSQTSQNKTAIKRLKKELDEIRKNPPVEVMIGPSDDSNMFEWEGLLNGPDGTPFQGGIFKFRVTFPENYPMKPPVVIFTTKMYHPNIDPHGHICVDILKNNWSSAYTISKVMLSVSSLLSDPNPDSALNGEAAKIYKTNRQEYNRTVKEWTKKFASPQNLS